MLPLKGCGIVLKVQWLVNSGSIVWDFIALIIKFQLHSGQWCQLSGIQPGAVNMMNARLCSKILQPMTVRIELYPLSTQSKVKENLMRKKGC